MITGKTVFILFGLSLSFSSEGCSKLLLLGSVLLEWLLWESVESVVSAESVVSESLEKVISGYTTERVIWCPWSNDPSSFWHWQLSWDRWMARVQWTSIWRLLSSSWMFRFIAWKWFTAVPLTSQWHGSLVKPQSNIRLLPTGHCRDPDGSIDTTRRLKMAGCFISWKYIQCTFLSCIGHSLWEWISALRVGSPCTPSHSSHWHYSQFSLCWVYTCKSTLLVLCLYSWSLWQALFRVAQFILTFFLPYKLVQVQNRNGSWLDYQMHHSIIRSCKLPVLEVVSGSGADWASWIISHSTNTVLMIILVLVFPG